jgi:Protein of unknown function (DUF3105)
LAKKTRTPPPPRRVQAPQKRTGRRDKDEQRRRLPLLLAAAGAIAVLAAIVGVALVMGGSSSGIAETMRSAGCTYRDVDAADNVRDPSVRHVEKLPKGFKYNTTPPTSGLHHPTTLIWGIYDAPVDQLRSVHNLEHGGVVIQFGRGVSAGEVGQIQEFYRDDPNGLVVAPLPSLGNRISLAAWTFDEARLVERDYQGEGRLALCPTFDEGAVSKFVDEYRFKGPERPDPATLTPGNP